MGEAGDKVCEIIRKHLRVSRERVVSGARFVEDLEVDSLEMIELVIAIEGEFDIEIPDEDVEKIATVGEVVEYVEKRAE